MKQVPLNQVVAHIEMHGGQMLSFWHKETGEISMFTQEDFDNLHQEKKWIKLSGADLAQVVHAQEIVDNPAYIRLPTRQQINLNRIIELYCNRIDDPDIQSHLRRTVHGTTKTDRFELALFQYGLENDWKKFREEMFYRIAANWCKLHGLPHTG